MDRNDWIWVAIRIFGIYLLILGIVAIPEALGSGLNTYALWRMGVFDLVSKDEKTFNKLMEIAPYLSANAFATSLAKVVLFSVAGSYFLKKGNFVFRLVSRQEPPKGSV